MRSAAAVNTLVQDVAVLFAPGRVIYLAYHRLDAPIGLVEAVVKADWVEAVSAVAKVRQQSDRPVGISSGLVFDQLPHAIRQEMLRLAQVVGTAKIGNIAPLRRPQPMPVEQAGQFG